MTVARSVASVLDDHVTLEVECVDRMYLNLYVPKLVYPAGVVGFFKYHRGMPVASGALMDPISKTFVAAIHRYVKDHDLDLVHFLKGQRKDDIALRYLAGHDDGEGITFVGRAQEKCSVFRTEHRVNPQTGARYPFLVKSSAVVNQFYFYGVDDDFGPFFFKFGTYFPYTAKLCLNAHHWAQRQATKAGIAFRALDNGFAACDDPAALQAICDSFGPEQIRAFVDKWLARLPRPLSDTDRAAGYDYDISILQAEFSLTQVLDRPAAGRIFFEEVIRDNLDAGRPEHISLIFDRTIRTRGKRPTPSRYRTRVLTSGVTPSIHVEYKHSKIKQYFKLGHAIRTEMTINDTTDFGVGRRLHNLASLARIGFNANRRLLDAQRISSDPLTGTDAYHQVCHPVIVNGQRVPALRFDHPVTQALLVALIVFRAHPDGFSNRELRELLAPMLGADPATMTPGRMTYHLRRLRLHGLIDRTPHTNRYRVNDFGLRSALVLTRLHNRLLTTVMADAADTGPPDRTPLAKALRAVATEIDNTATRARLQAA
jgi:hypothetical protein